MYLESFNPSFGGFISKTYFYLIIFASQKVSILRLVDLSLKPSGITGKVTGKLVSILRLVDLSLKQLKKLSLTVHSTGFNPSFGGFISKTRKISV